MNQNSQPRENITEIKVDGEGELFRTNLKRPLSQKAIILFLVVILLIAVGAVYYIFFNKEDSEILPAEENIEIIKDEEAAKSEIDKKLDTDQDGLPDYLEKILGTDENNLDTDGDSYDDYNEIKNGYNPLNTERYTEEEWGVAKEKIGNEDEGLFEEMFENYAEALDWKTHQNGEFGFKFEYPSFLLLEEKKMRKLAGIHRQC